MKSITFIFGVICLVTSSVATAQEISLACQGISHRDEGNNKHTEVPLVVNLHLDLTFGKLTSSSLNCWSGKGDCSLLTLRIGENSIAALGGGDLTGSGYRTSIEMDRRSGFLSFHQGRDPSMPLPSTTQQHAQSEDAELICQGGPRPRF